MDPVKFQTDFEKAMETGDFSGLKFSDVSTRLKETKAAASEAEVEAQNNAFSFKNILKSVPSAAGKVVAQGVLHPIESTKKVASTLPDIGFGAAEGIYSFGRGLTNIATFGKVKAPTLQEFEKNTFIDAFVGKGFDYEAAESAWDSYMTPEKQDARTVGGFLGVLAPYAGMSGVAVKGLAYAAPKFVQAHKVISTILASAGGDVVAGQLVEDPDATAQERASRAKWDAALGIAIPAIGPAYKAARGTIFKRITKTKLGGEGAVIEPIPSTKPTGEAPPVSKGSKPIASVISEDGRMAVTTNNLDAVRNYVKDSGKTNIVINEKPPGTLGLTRDGIPITANHAFDAKTGTHTFTVSSAVDAETIAHEWGHYVNDEVAKQVRGLSNYLFGESTAVRNAQAIEDTLRSLATKELAGEGRTLITPEMIDRRMSTLVTSIREDVRKLSSLRPEPRKLSGARLGSEKLADAVSVALTDSSAYRRTSLYKFLETANVVDDKLVQSIRAASKAGMRVEAGTNKTALELAKERQGAATGEKLGLGGEQMPKRPTRPGSKFEKTTVQKEEAAFAKVPQKVVVRSSQEIDNVIKKNKIPGKNLVEINVKDKMPVTLVVHETDRVLLRAIQLGADSKYMDYARRLLMKEFGFTARQADAYMAKRFTELKAFAQANAEATNPVMAKVVRDAEPQAPVEAQAGQPQPGTEIKKSKATGEDMIVPDEANALEEAEFQVLTEMELSEAGQRFFSDAAGGFAGSRPSTFPQWVPDHLRNKKLFNSVADLITEGREPAPAATRQKELFDIVQEKIKQRSDELREGNRGEAESIFAKEDEILTRERELAESEYNDVFATRESDQSFAPTETPPSEAVGFGVEGEGALKLDLDRMETGRKPGTEPIRAELMAGSPEEEVFLNTKVLPEISGKFRIGRSNESILQDAMRSDMTADNFLNILNERVGALTPDVRKGFEIAMDKAEGLRTRLAGRAASELTPTELASFKQDLAQTVQMFEVYSGIRTEASNLLRSFGINMARGEDDVLRQIFNDLQKAGVASEKDVWRAMAKTYETMQKNTVFEKYMKGLYAAWLSGPATTLRNTLGNLGNIVAEIGSKAANPKQWNELPGVMSNLLKDFREKGLPDARKILSGEQTMAGKFTSVYDPQFPVPVDAFSATPKSAYDRITESVGKFLNAQDIALSRTVQEMEKRSLKIYKPDVSEAVSKAVSEMYGLATVYRGLPKSRSIRAAVMATETLTREAPGFKIFFPFVRTIGNVLDRQFDYLPIFSSLRLREGPLLEQARLIAKKYALSSEDDIQLIMQRLKDQQTGRMYLGLGLTASAVVMAKNGKVSGNGPSNYNQRLQLERTGWRRNSIKIGDTWIPYTFFGPLAGIFSMAGNVHDAIEYDNASDNDIISLIGTGLIGWGQTQLNMSFLKGASDLLSVFTGDTDPKKYFSNLGASLTPVPAAYTQTLNIGRGVYSRITGDVEARQQVETRNVVDALRVKLGLQGSVGGLLDPLNKKSDMFGGPMTLDLIYGITPTSDKIDSMPVDALLINEGIVVTIPPKNQTFVYRNKETKLTPDEYQEYVRESGKMIYAELNKKLPTLKKLKADKLQDFVADIVSKNREKARKEIFSRPRSKEE